MDNSAFRKVRDRLDEWDAAIDRFGAEPIDGAARMAISIYDGGHFGSTGGVYYLGNPVQFYGEPYEGGGYSTWVDTNTTIVADVLGSAPQVGDILVAYGVGGRWVAERGGQPADCCSTTCLPCPIPRKDLLISWVNPVTGNGSDTLAYSPNSGTWATGCSGGEQTGNQLLFKLLCSEGQTELRVSYFVSGVCPTGQSNSCSNLLTNPAALVEGTAVCSPYSVPFTLSNVSCPALASSGFTGFTVSDPDPPQPGKPHCCTTVCVQGPCAAIADALVTVSGGTLAPLSSTTTTGGCVVIDIGGAGTYTVDVTATGYLPYSQTQVLKCCETLTIQLQPIGETGPYTCCGTCPLPQTGLSLTDANGTYPIVDGVVSYSIEVEGVDLVGTYFLCRCAETLTTVSLEIIYNVGCTVVNGVAMLRVTRLWACVGCGGCDQNEVLPPYHYPGTGPCDQLCTSVFQLQPSNPAVVSSTLAQVWSSCEPFAWSGSLVPQETLCPDPVGGMVVVNS